jgi:hypothetical protein
MMRLARSIFLVSTAFATLVAAMLQGRVLCSADGGTHFAIEEPHEHTGCPDGHDEHPATEREDRPLPGDCTDISADFSLAREVAPASPDVLHAPLAGLSPLSLIVLVARADHEVYAHASVDHPPGSEDLPRLRTIVLLA